MLLGYRNYECTSGNANERTTVWWVVDVFEVVVAVGDVAVTGDAGYAGWVTGDIFVTRPDPGYHPTP